MRYWYTWKNIEIPEISFKISPLLKDHYWDICITRLLRDHYLYYAHLIEKPSPHDEHQSSGPRPVKLCSVFILIYIKINSRIWFGPVNSNFHFEDFLKIIINITQISWETTCLERPPVLKGHYVYYTNFF